MGEGAFLGRDLALHGDVRPGVPSDWLHLSWLIETSHRVYTHWGNESLRQLLAGPGAVLWYEGRALRGALLVDVQPRGVGEARLLAVHDDADLTSFAGAVFPLLERRLARSQTRWLSFSNPERWLLDLLVARGYALKDRVVTYLRPGTDLRSGGNAAVRVQPALPEHLPGMLTVDAAAFEAFWRLDDRALRRALDEEAYVLVALGTPPLRARGDRNPEAVIGYLVADVWEARAHIVRLAVAPEYQGRGVATRLIAEVLRLMTADGAVREVTVNTQETNARSRGLYERLGFALTPTVEEVWARALDSPPDDD